LHVLLSLYWQAGPAKPELQVHEPVALQLPLAPQVVAALQWLHVG
jgi:hypothetical protein